MAAAEVAAAAPQPGRRRAGPVGPGRRRQGWSGRDATAATAAAAAVCFPMIIYKYIHIYTYISYNR